jgi:hypothetical protein
MAERVVCSRQTRVEVHDEIMARPARDLPDFSAACVANAVMSFFLKMLGFGLLVMAALVCACVITFVWVRHGGSAIGGLFALGGGLDFIALAFAFGPGVLLLLMGYWIGRRPGHA